MRNSVSYILLSLISCVVAQTENSNACTTPVNKQGFCIPLRNCISLFNQVLKGKELTPADRQYLSSSQCGYRNNQPLVCCPDINSTTVVNDVLPRPGKCGNNPMDRIIRGIAADLDTYTWMALLVYSKPNNTKEVHCSGALISQRYVLTVAHCLVGNNIPSTWNVTGVRLREHDLLKDPDCVDYSGGLDCNLPVVDVPISEQIIHELYDPLSKNRANDIALLRLESDVASVEFVHPICLPRSQKLTNFNYDDTTLLEISGWNRATTEYSVKLTGRVDVVETLQCNRKYNSLGVVVQDTQLCANSRPNNYDSCLGLSGSPLMGVNSDEGYVYWYLAGIEAFGAPSCSKGDWPNVYTRITPYIEWIESKVKV